MKSPAFKESLKAVVSNLEQSSFSATEKLLNNLHLLPLPKGVEASISEDNQFLNIKQIDSPDNQHLLFQFPLIPTDLTALKNRDDYQELIDRYQLYTNAYIDEIKQYALEESKYLREKFPSLICPIKLRVKSFYSYIEKLNTNITNGKDPYINDIIAERIILSQYEGSQDEKMLTHMCDEVAKTLYDFRINTNFRMNKVIDPNRANSNKEYVTRDYIHFPKDNGYQSYHIQMRDKYNSDLTYETQIRTFGMEEFSKTSGEIAHTKYKPRPLNDLSPIRVPLYSEIPCILNSTEEQRIYDLSFQERFYHFYNSDTGDHSVLVDKLNPITYSRFRHEQHELEAVLGVEFKTIRKRLMDLNKENNKNNKDNNSIEIIR